LKDQEETKVVTLPKSQSISSSNDHKKPTPEVIVEDINK